VVAGRVQAAYDRIAPAFAERVRGQRQSLAPLLEAVAARVGPGAAVLDLGCGPGYDTARLAELGVRAVGGDLSGGMLAQARLATGRPLVQLDLGKLPFHAGSFAGVWCIASLLHVPKAEAPAALAEVRRVLRPGGVLALAMQEGEGEEWNAGHVEGVLRFFARYSADEMAGLLEGAGFRVLEQERERVGRMWLRYLAELPE
jgi:ubiquinone/menaquinone biosynthesis C-methylase UbiE